MTSSISAKVQTSVTEIVRDNAGDGNALNNSAPISFNTERLPAEHLPNVSLLNRGNLQHSVNVFSSSVPQNASKQPTESKTVGAKDIDDFQKQSEERALKQMKMQEHLANLAEQKAMHSSILKQQRDDTEATTKYAEASSKIGKTNAGEYNH